MHIVDNVCWFDFMTWNDALRQMKITCRSTDGYGGHATIKVDDKNNELTLISMERKNANKN